MPPRFADLESLPPGFSSRFLILPDEEGMSDDTSSNGTESLAGDDGGGGGINTAGFSRHQQQPPPQSHRVGGGSSSHHHNANSATTTHHHATTPTPTNFSSSLSPPFKTVDPYNQTTEYYCSLNDHNNSNSNNGHVKNESSGDGIVFDDDDTNEDELLGGQVALAGREDRRMTNNLRVVVIVLMTSLCIAIPLILYFATQKNQNDTFEMTFTGLADKVADSVQNQMTLKVQSLQTLALTLTQYGRINNSNTDSSDWPFVAMSDWTIRAGSIQKLGGLVNVNLCPLVKLEDREKWEQWVPENLEWFEVGTAFQEMEQQQQKNIVEETSTVSNDGQHRILPSSTLPSNSLFPNRLNGSSRQPFQQAANTGSVTTTTSATTTNDVISHQIFGPDPASSTGFSAESDDDAPYLPIWMNVPIIPRIVNYNFLSSPFGGGDAAALTLDTGKTVLSSFANLTGAGTAAEATVMESLTQLFSSYMEDPDYIYQGDPVASFAVPVFENLDDSRQQQQQVVAVLTSVVHFEQLFVDVLQSSEGGSILVVLSNTCGDLASYGIDGEAATYLGPGDYHDTSFDYIKRSYSFSDLMTTDLNMHSDYCIYNVDIYPTDDIHEQYISNAPLTYALVTAFVFIFVGIIFFSYDYFLRRRLKRVIKSAKNNRAIVTSLFPANVRDRLLQEEEDRKQRQMTNRRSSLNSNGSQHSTSRRNSAEHIRRHSNERRISLDMCSRRSSNEGRRNSNDNGSSHGKRSSMVQGVSTVVTQSVNVAGSMAGYLLMAPSKFLLKSYLNDNIQSSPIDTYRTEKSDEESLHGKPIADLFPSCTVLFADISGFTAWSSEREPEQVFKLLQEVFQCFDSLAKKRKVFKVETIGDCYVSTTHRILLNNATPSFLLTTLPFSFHRIDYKPTIHRWQ
jgi:Adenylate and Guanylate cyclase catalytic domain